MPVELRRRLTSLARDARVDTVDLLSRLLDRYEQQQTSQAEDAPR